MLFSVNKMLRGLSNAGRGLCVGRSRIYREAWVADFAMSGWVGLAQMRGYWPPSASVASCAIQQYLRSDYGPSWPNKNAADLIRPRVNCR